MRVFSLSKIFCLAFACAFATGTLFADEKKSAGPGGKKITDPTSTLEGYFVRVKSGISGEKELYYNKDGTLRASLGDGLLGGDFSLDSSLLGEGDTEFELDLGETVPDATKAESADEQAPVKTQPMRPTPPRVREDDDVEDEEENGTVDEHSILKKFSRERRDFGLNSANFKKVVNKDVSDRYGDAVSLREWQGETAYGIRRYSEGMDAYEMRSSEFDRRSVSMGLFDTRSSLAGERMFVRNSEGLIEVRLNEKFSSLPVRANERTRSVRESSGFSMQDINRYQFRRNRSSDAGLPVVSPGGDGNVRKENFGNAKTKSEN